MITLHLNPHECFGEGNVANCVNCRIAAKSDTKSGYITKGFQYCVFTYVNKERIVTTHHAMTAETVIPSGSIPAGLPRAFRLNKRDTTAVKFSGVRSSGQYCRPENLRQ